MKSNKVKLIVLFSILAIAVSALAVGNLMARPSSQTAGTVTLSGGVELSLVTGKPRFYSDKTNFNVITGDITDADLSPVRAGTVRFITTGAGHTTVFNLATTQVTSGGGNPAAVIQGEVERSETFVGDGSTRVYPVFTNTYTAQSGDFAVDFNELTKLAAGKVLADRDGDDDVDANDVIFKINGTVSTTAVQAVTPIAATGGRVTFFNPRVNFAAGQVISGAVGIGQTTGDVTVALGELPVDTNFDGVINISSRVPNTADIFVTVTAGGGLGAAGDILTNFIFTADPPQVRFVASPVAGAGVTVTFNFTYGASAVNTGDTLSFTYTATGNLAKLPRDSGIAQAIPSANGVYDDVDTQVTVSGAILDVTSTTAGYNVTPTSVTGDFSTVQLVQLDVAPGAGAGVTIKYQFTEFDVATPTNTPLTLGLTDHTVSHGPTFAVAADTSAGFVTPGAGTFTVAPIVPTGGPGAGRAVTVTFKYNVTDTKIDIATVKSTTSINLGLNRKTTGGETSQTSNSFRFSLALFQENDRIKIDTESKDLAGNDALGTGDNDGVVQVDELNLSGGLGAGLNTRVQNVTVIMGLDPATTAASALLNRILVISDADTITVEYPDADPAATIINTVTATVDLTAPTITLVRPADLGFSGTETTLEVDVTDLGAGIVQASANINPPTGVALIATKSVITNGHRLTSSVGLTTVIPEGAHTWNVVVTDQVGNTPNAVDSRTQAETDAKVANPAVRGTLGNKYAFTVDNAAPTIDRAETGGKLDTDPTSATAEEIIPLATAKNAITVFLSLGVGGAPVDADTVTPSDFEVSLNPVIPVIQVIVGKDGAKILLVLDQDLDSGARPTVKLIGTISDKATNDKTNVTVPADKVLDKLAPTVTATIVGEAASTPASSNEVVISITSSEAGTISGTARYLMASGDAFRIAAAGDGTLAEDTQRGIAPNLSFTSAGVKAWESKIIIRNIMGSMLDSSGVVNVQITVEDGGGNKGTAGLADPEGTANKKGVLDALALVFEFDSLLNGGASAVDQIFVLSPNTNTAADPKTDNPLAFITVNFDTEGKEYVNTGDVTGSGTFGVIDMDTHPGVTLTKAELEWPDATKEDVLAKFSKSDDNSYVLGSASLRDGAGLVLGNYKLTVQAEDVLGNNSITAALTPGGLTNPTSFIYDFTVTERALYNVTLAPGLNLVSLPGDPVDGDINKIIGAGEGVDLVTTYDPTAALGPWLVATRNADTGLFEGTLTSLDTSHAYWMRATSFVSLTVDIPLAALTGQLPPTIGVAEGWNLVPIVDLTRRPFGTAIDADAYLSGVNWALAYTFDTLGSAWKRIVPDPTNQTVAPRCELATDPSAAAVACDATNTILKILDTGITVGRGYWVWATEAGTIVP